LFSSPPFLAVQQRNVHEEDDEHAGEYLVDMIDDICAVD